jgi:uncharacterized protein (DUF2267 family)
MQYEQFIDHIQSRAHLESHDAAMKAARATLETLSERLTGNEPANLADQLPEQVGKFLKKEGGPEAFSMKEFYNRVSKKEEIDLSEAKYHARAVMDVVREAVTSGELDNIRNQLPDEYRPLFTPLDEDTEKNK